MARIQVSPSQVVLGQQVRATVTIANTGRAADPAAHMSIGTMIPDDTFDGVPATCTPGNGGAYCPVPALRPGEKTSLVFTITLNGFADELPDEISGPVYYLDSHSQTQQAAFFSTQVKIIAAPGSSSPPTSGTPTPPPSATSTATPSATPSTTPTPTQ